MIFILWGISCTIQIGFTIHLLIPFLRVTKTKKATSTPSISVIVAARNEHENLKILIPLLVNQNYRHFEIIIALDRCSDSSLEFLKQQSSEKIKFIDIKDVPADWNPKKYALNCAIEKSNHEWLVFTDADCFPVSSNWWLSLSNEMRGDTEVILGISPYQSGSTFLSQFILFETFKTAFLYISKALKGKPYMGVGRNMAIKKGAFVKAGGYSDFKSIKAGDDDLLIQEIGTESNTAVALGAESLVLTHPKNSWLGYWNQKIRHLSVGTRYRLADQLFLSTYHLSHIAFIVLLFFNLSSTYFFPLLLFYLFIKLVSYRFVVAKMGTGINYMLLPLVDMLYAMLIPMVALWSKLVKDIKWKN